MEHGTWNMEHAGTTEGTGNRFICCFLCFLFTRTEAPSARARVKNLEKYHSAALSTLGVLYSLLVVEGEGVDPRASGIRKRGWVCSADAGVCPAWKAAGKVSTETVRQ